MHALYPFTPSSKHQAIIRLASSNVEQTLSKNQAIRAHVVYFEYICFIV